MLQQCEKVRIFRMDAMFPQEMVALIVEIEIAVKMNQVDKTE